MTDYRETRIVDALGIVHLINWKELWCNGVSFCGQTIYELSGSKCYSPDKDNDHLCQQCFREDNEQRQQPDPGQDES